MGHHCHRLLLGTKRSLFSGLPCLHPERTGLPSQEEPRDFTGGSFRNGPNELSRLRSIQNSAEPARSTRGTVVHDGHVRRAWPMAWRTATTPGDGSAPLGDEKQGEKNGGCTGGKPRPLLDTTCFRSQLLSTSFLGSAGAALEVSVSRSCIRFLIEVCHSGPTEFQLVHASGSSRAQNLT